MASNAYSGYCIPKPRWTCDTIRIEDITPELFFKNFITKRKPVKFASGMNHTLVGIDRKQWTIESLQKMNSSYPITVETRQNNKESFGKGTSTTIPVETFLDRIKSGDNTTYMTVQPIPENENGPTQLMTGILLKLRKQFPLRPQLLGNLIPHQYNMWMGNSQSGSSSGLHHDHHDNLYVVLAGKKKFRIFSPADANKFHTHGSIVRVLSNGLANYRFPSRLDGAHPLSVVEYQNKLDTETQTMEQIKNETVKRLRHTHKNVLQAQQQLRRAKANMEIAEFDHARAKIRIHVAQENKKVENTDDTRHSSEPMTKRQRTSKNALNQIGSIDDSEKDTDELVDANKLNQAMDNDLDAMENDKENDDVTCLFDAVANGSEEDDIDDEQKDNDDDGDDKVIDDENKAIDDDDGDKVIDDDDDKDIDDEEEEDDIDAALESKLDDLIKQDNFEDEDMDDFDSESDLSSISDASEQMSQLGPDNFSPYSITEQDEKEGIFENSNMGIVEVNAGEMLYLPAGWFHEVISCNDKENKHSFHCALNYWLHPPSTDDYSNPYVDGYWETQYNTRLQNTIN